MAIVVESVGTGTLTSDSTTLTITAPTSIADGNLLLSVVARDTTNAGNVAISGFTRLTYDVDAAASSDSFIAGRCVDLLRKAAASESGNYSATWTGNQQAAGIILRISGHHATSPIVFSASGYAFGQFEMAYRPRVPAGTLIIVGAGINGNPTMSKYDGPTSTERANFPSNTTGGMCKLFVHSYIQAAAGYVAPFTMQSSADAEIYDFIVGIRDAADVGTVESGLHSIEQGISA